MISRTHTLDIISEFDRFEAIIETAKIYGKITVEEYMAAADEMWRLYYLSGTAKETSPAKRPDFECDPTCHSGMLNSKYDHWDGLD
jgi:hypothetical protein